MNPDPEQLRALLEEVLPSSGEHCGPTSGGIVSMLRRERQRRRRLHASAGLLAVVALTAGALLWNPPPVAVAPVVQALPARDPTVIHRVNDEELFALLKGTPVALMHRPDGGRTLLIIEQASSQ